MLENRTPSAGTGNSKKGGYMGDQQENQPEKKKGSKWPYLIAYMVFILVSAIFAVWWVNLQKSDSIPF